MNQYLLPNIHGYLHAYRYGRLVEEYRREVRSDDDYNEISLRLQKHILSFHDRIYMRYGYQGKPHLQHYAYCGSNRTIYNGMACVGEQPRNYLYTYEDPNWLREVIDGS